MPCHYAPVGPWRKFRSAGKKTKSEAKFGPKNDCSARPWGRRALILVNGSCLVVGYSGTQQVFYVIRLYILVNSLFFNLTPKKTPKQKGLFMGFPGTFARLKSRLRHMAGKQLRYGPNASGNQAPGRSATMVTRTASRVRYSIKFRSTCSQNWFCLGVMPLCLWGV